MSYIVQCPSCKGKSEFNYAWNKPLLCPFCGKAFENPSWSRRVQEVKTLTATRIGGIAAIVLGICIMLVNLGGWTGRYGAPEWRPARWAVFWQPKPQTQDKDDNNNATEQQPARNPHPSSQKVTPDQISTQIKTTGEKIKALEDRRVAVSALVAKRTKEREKVIAALKALGVTDSSGLKGNQKAQTYARDLTLIVSEIEALAKADERFDVAILQAQAHIRILERALVVGDASISEQEFAEFRTKMLSLDDKLGDVSATQAAADPIRVEQILKKQLQEK